MANLQGRPAWILLTVLVLTAVIGFEQGLTRSLSAAREAAPATDSTTADREPVPRAQALSAAPLDEAQVRQIARQEAEAAIVRSKPKKAPTPDEADDQGDPGPGPPVVLPPTAPVQPAAAPPPG